MSRKNKQRTPEDIQMRWEWRVEEIKKRNERRFRLGIHNERNWSYYYRKDPKAKSYGNKRSILWQVSLRENGMFVNWEGQPKATRGTLIHRLVRQGYLKRITNVPYPNKFGDRTHTKVVLTQKGKDYVKKYCGV